MLWYKAQSTSLSMSTSARMCALSSGQNNWSHWDKNSCCGLDSWDRSVLRQRSSLDTATAVSGLHFKHSASPLSFAVWQITWRPSCWVRRITIWSSTNVVAFAGALLSITFGQSAINHAVEVPFVDSVGSFSATFHSISMSWTRLCRSVRCISGVNLLSWSG